MGRYLIIWRTNLAAWPKDPTEGLKIMESSYNSMDDALKVKGLVKDYGDFVDGMSGYIVCEGEPADILRAASMGQPFWIGEVHEVVPYEKAKEAWRDVFKAWIEAKK